MKIFITGATGFVGYYITESLLHAGHTITALVRPASQGIEKLKKLNTLISIVEGKLNDIDVLDKVLPGHDMIIHSAGQVSFKSSDNKSMMHTNVQATAALVNSALEHKIPKFIFISSIAALGGLKDQLKYDESTEWDLKTYHHGYAVSKHFAELEVWRGHAEGLDVCILSPSVVLGNWYTNHHSLAFFKELQKGIKFSVPGSTGWVDARNVGDAVCQVIEKNIVNERIIINGHNASFDSLVTACSKLINTSLPKITLPYKIALGGTKLISMFSNLLNIEITVSPHVVRAAYSKREFDNTKSRELLGINYYPLEESIRFALTSFHK